METFASSMIHDGFIGKKVLLVISTSMTDGRIGSSDYLISLSSFSHCLHGFGLHLLRKKQWPQKYKTGPGTGVFEQAQRVPG